MVKRKTYFDTVKVTDAAVISFLAESGISITQQAKLLAPWKTGLLRGSINWVMQRDGGGLSEIATEQNRLQQPARKHEVKIGTNVEYAEYQEYGTRRSPTGRPYLRPALRIMKGKLKARWNVLLKRAVRDA